MSRLRRVAGLGLALLCVYPISTTAQAPTTAPPGRDVVAAPSRAIPPEIASEPPGFIAEPSIVDRAAAFMDHHFANGDITNGFYTDFGNMIPRGRLDFGRPRLPSVVRPSSAIFTT
jgi:hypothetical protein